MKKTKFLAVFLLMFVFSFWFVSPFHTANLYTVRTLDYHYDYNRVIINNDLDDSCVLHSCLFRSILPFSFGCNTCWW